MLKLTKNLEKLLLNVDDLKEEVGEILSKKEDTYGNRSEKWQDSDAGQEMQELISNLEELVEHLDNAVGKFNEIFE